MREDMYQSPSEARHPQNPGYRAPGSQINPAAHQEETEPTMVAPTPNEHTSPTSQSSAHFRSMPASDTVRDNPYPMHSGQQHAQTYQSQDSFIADDWAAANFDRIQFTTNDFDGTDPAGSQGMAAPTRNMYGGSFDNSYDPVFNPHPSASYAQDLYSTENSNFDDSHDDPAEQGYMGGGQQAVVEQQDSFQPTTPENHVVENSEESSLETGNMIFMPRDGFPGFYNDIDHYLGEIGHQERLYYRTIALPENQGKLPSPAEQKYWVNQMCLAVIDCTKVVDKKTKDGKPAQPVRQIMAMDFSGEYIEHICWDILFYACCAFLKVPRLVGRQEVPFAAGSARGRTKEDYSSLQGHMENVVWGLKYSKAIFKSSCDGLFAARYGAYPMAEYEGKLANIATNQRRNTQVQLANEVISQAATDQKRLESLGLQGDIQKRAEDLVEEKKIRSSRTPPSSRYQGSEKKRRSGSDQGEHPTPSKLRKTAGRVLGSTDGEIMADGGILGMSSRPMRASSLNQATNTSEISGFIAPSNADVNNISNLPNFPTRTAHPLNAAHGLGQHPINRLRGETTLSNGQGRFAPTSASLNMASRSFARPSHPGTTSLAGNGMAANGPVNHKASNQDKQ